jgi:Holliday junction resolvase-like predicted endonuclease
VMIEKINYFLKYNFGFSLDEAKAIIDSTMERVCLPLGAGILVQPTSEVSHIISSASNISLDTVSKFIDFLSLDTLNDNYSKREYLRKSQPIRMLNFCAVRLSLDGFHEAIYDSTSAKIPSIKSAPSHLIFSISAAAEWLDMLVNKIASGQRQDLKSTKELSEQLAAIEKFYHENIFEKQTSLLFEKAGLPTLINLKKVNSKELPCGEIDVLSYDFINRKLYIVECKNIAPTTDARAAGQVLSDHFKQKKYHHKFIKKIEWVKNNKAIICAIFYEKSRLNLPIDFLIEPIFATAYPSVVKFSDVEYSVMTFFELRSKILGNGKY